MPSRIVVVGIVAFWFAVTGFTFYRDIWPRLFASGPPPVTIELADEAKQNLIQAKWRITRNGQKIGNLNTQMKYIDSEDTFQFTYHYTDLKLEQTGITLSIPDATSEIRMTRNGELKEQTMNGKVKVTLRDAEIAHGTIRIRGVVNNGVLTGRAELKSNLGELADDLESVPVPPGGQPLNPLQPVNRLGRVRGGDSWFVDESNPLQDAILGLLKKKLPFPLPEGKKKSLMAQVSDSPQTLTWEKQDVPCWVIEYRRDEVIARTWVRMSDGKVLRQEAFEKGETLSFERLD